MDEIVLGADSSEPRGLKVSLASWEQPRESFGYVAFSVKLIKWITCWPRHVHDRIIRYGCLYCSTLIRSRLLNRSEGIGNDRIPRLIMSRIGNDRILRLIMSKIGSLLIISLINNVDGRNDYYIIFRKCFQIVFVNDDIGLYCIVFL